MVRPAYLTPRAIEQFIDLALAEDIGSGDVSTLGSVPKEKQATAKLLVKDAGMLAGIELALAIGNRYDNGLRFNMLLNDGDVVKKGDVAFTLLGSARSILSVERLILNCMQRMSGIATKTNHLVQRIAHTRAQLMDTRKTTPNFRLPEKWAVHIGGGCNHRFALYDMVMLKDNHIDVAGGIAQAVKNVRTYLDETKQALKIEVETRTLAEVKQALAAQTDVIMLDNMTIAQMHEAVHVVNGQCKLEASGGITEDNIAAVAETGVDYISVGALTHSVRSLDLSLKIAL